MSNKTEKEAGATSINNMLKAIEILDARIETAKEVTQKAQAATREAREALAALVQEKKSTEALKASLADLVRVQVGELITETTSRELATMGRITQEQMQKSVAKVISEFDFLEKVLTGKENPDRPSIPELLEQARAATGIEWPRMVDYVTAAAHVALGCTTDACLGIVKYAVRFKVTGILGDGHLHVCHKCLKGLQEDSKVSIIATVRMETGVCPWKHPPIKSKIFRDAETGDLAYVVDESVFGQYLKPQEEVEGI